MILGSIFKLCKINSGQDLVKGTRDAHITLSIVNDKIEGITELEKQMIVERIFLLCK